eukprot:2106562-Prymnesium_polylepis.1
MASVHPQPGEPPRTGVACWQLGPGPHYTETCAEMTRLRVCACREAVSGSTTLSYEVPPPPTSVVEACTSAPARRLS